MIFIVTRFLHMITRDYNFEYTFTRLPDGAYAVDITNIPQDLKIKCSNLKYSFIKSIVSIRDKHGNVTESKYIMDTNSVCQGIYNPVTGIHGIRVVFTEDTYANKVNKLDYTMRRYYESNSRVDEINHRY